MLGSAAEDAGLRHAAPASSIGLGTSVPGPMSCEVARALTGRLAKVLIGQGPCQDVRSTPRRSSWSSMTRMGLLGRHPANSARMGGSICRVEPHPDAATMHVEDLLVDGEPEAIGDVEHGVDEAQEVFAARADAGERIQCFVGQRSLEIAPTPRQRVAWARGAAASRDHNCCLKRRG